MHDDDSNLLSTKLKVPNVHGLRPVQPDLSQGYPMMLKKLLQLLLLLPRQMGHLLGVTTNGDSKPRTHCYGLGIAPGVAVNCNTPPITVTG